MEALEAVAAEVAQWRADPSGAFAKGVLGLNLWKRQREILDAVTKYRRVAVPSCHESGKTFVASVAAVHWLLSYQPSKVITTAPSQRQVRDLLWSEIRARHAGLVKRLAPYELRMGTPALMDWKIPGAPEWYATGFATTPDKASDNATRMQGYHSPHLLMILDEAGGLARPVWGGVEALMTSEGSHVLAIGQPQAGSEFERVCRSPDWHVLRISAFDCPNLQPGAPPSSWGVTRKWVEEKRRDWGEGSAIYLSKVLGLFPKSSVDTLISLEAVERAFERRPPAAAETWVALGVDVARFGNDETVIYVIRDGAILAVESWIGQDTMKTCGRVVAMALEFGLDRAHGHRIAIDDTGVGGGVTDRLRELKWPVTAVNFGSGPVRTSSEERFANRRTEIWWDMRVWIRETAALAEVAEEFRDKLRADLTAPKYEQKSDGRIALEPKDDIRERTGRSPDHGDALALAVAAQRQAPRFAWETYRGNVKPDDRRDDDRDGKPKLRGLRRTRMDEE